MHPEPPSQGGGGHIQPGIGIKQKHAVALSNDAVGLGRGIESLSPLEVEFEVCSDSP